MSLWNKHLLCEVPALLSTQQCCFDLNNVRALRLKTNKLAACGCYRVGKTRKRHVLYSRRKTLGDTGSVLHSAVRTWCNLL